MSEADPVALAVTIRVVRPEEHQAVGALMVAAYVADGFIDASSPYVARLADTATRAAGAEVLVAVDASGRLVGTVTYCPAGSEWREIARADEGEFRMLAVLPEARGLGIGGALVRACLDRARAEGRAGVAISSMATMREARRLYERFGFVRAPEQDWSPRGEVALEALRLRWPLTGVTPPAP